MPPKKTAPQAPSFLLDTNVCLDFDKIEIPTHQKLFVSKNILREIDSLKKGGLSRLVNAFCENHLKNVEILDFDSPKPGDEGIMDCLVANPQLTLLTRDSALHFITLRMKFKSMLCEQVDFYNGRGDQYPFSFLEESWGVFPNLGLEMHKPESCFGLRPKNVEQNCLLATIMHPDSSLVVVTGSAGSGKTVCTMAAAMELAEAPDYEKIIIARPMIAMGKEMGALPGDHDEKSLPWLSGIQDNLKLLFNLQSVKPDSKKSLNAYQSFMESEKIEIQPLAYIRGRSLRNSILIVDEAQNCSFSELVAIITRCCEGSKVILVGDPKQSDLPANQRSGLMDVSNLLKADPSFAHVHLFECHRSGLVKRFLELLER